jgi:hypothetical protein
MQMAIQQGTQITQVIGPMGAAGAAKALGTAFMSLFNPVNLVTYAVLAGGAALIQWAMGAGETKEKAKTVSDQIDDLEAAVTKYTASAKNAAKPTSELAKQYGGLADGTQICWGSVNCGSILAEGVGTAANPYRTAAVNASFAAAFSAAPVVPQPQVTDGGGTSPQDRAVVATYSTNTTGVTVLRLHRTTTSAVAATFTAAYVAIGRWF